MRKIALVLIVVIAAVVGASALTTNVRKPKLCPPSYKPLHCVDGRIVCCGPHEACDCGGGVPVR
jgi:hypothetical protein